MHALRIDAVGTLFRRHIHNRIARFDPHPGAEHARYQSIDEFAACPRRPQGHRPHHTGVAQMLQGADRQTVTFKKIDDLRVGLDKQALQRRVTIGNIRMQRVCALGGDEHAGGDARIAARPRAPFKHDHAGTRLGRRQRRDQARKAGTHNGHIKIIHRRVRPLASVASLL